MTGCIVEHEETLSKAICPALKDSDHMVNLGEEFIQIKISVVALPWFEHDVGLSTVHIRSATIIK